MRIKPFLDFPIVDSIILSVFNNNNLEICGSEIEFKPNNKLIIKEHYFLRDDPLVKQTYLNLINSLPKKITKEEFKNLLNTYNIIYASF